MQSLSKHGVQSLPKRQSEIDGEERIEAGELVELRGIEPLTSSLRTRRSPI